MNKNIFLQNLVKSKINNTNDDKGTNLSLDKSLEQKNIANTKIFNGTFGDNLINNIAQVIISKSKTINNNNDISDNLINIDKYNPDVMTRYKNLNRINNFEFTNNCYKPITSNMPTSINNANDLIIHSNDENPINITERYNILYNQRIEEFNRLTQLNLNNRINHNTNNINNHDYDYNQNYNYDFNSIKKESNNNNKNNQLLDSNYDEIFNKLNLNN